MPRERDDDDRYEDDDRPRRRRRRDEDEDDDRPPPKKGMSTGVILLIVFGVLAVVALPVIAILIGLLLPAVQKVREAASRQQASNNAKELTIAFHNYHDANGKLHGPFAEPSPSNPPRFPPANPFDRLSWRAAVLPYLEQDGLYRRLKFEEPWNSPTNSSVTSTVVRQFTDPIDGPPTTNTRIRCFYDNGALFDSDPNKRVNLARITDGSSNTIAYVESTGTVPWGQFNEFAYTPNGPIPQLGHPTRNTFMALMADGSVRWVSKGVSSQTLNAAITKSGGEVLGADW